MTLTSEQIAANRRNLSADQCIYHLSKIHELYNSLNAIHRLPFNRPGESESQAALRRHTRSMVLQEIKYELRREMREAMSLWKLLEAHIGEIYAEDT